MKVTVVATQCMKIGTHVCPELGKRSRIKTRLCVLSNIV